MPPSAPAITPQENKPVPAPVVPPAPWPDRQMSIEELLNAHDAELTFTKPGTIKMIQTGRAAILRFCPSLEKFSCVNTWKDYQASGLRKNPRPVGTPRAAASSLESWNLKASGKRSLLRLTASLKRKVGTA